MEYQHKPYPEFDSEPHTWKESKFVGRMTLPEVIEWAKQQGLSPEDVTFSSGHFVHQRTETAEEVEKRRERYERGRSAHVEFIRARYEEFFGSAADATEA